MTAMRDEDTKLSDHHSVHAHRQRLNEAKAAERKAELTRLIEKTLSASEQTDVLDFATEFFREAPADDVCERTAEQLFGALMTVWRGMAKRAPGETLVSLINPRMSEHGWSSPHTAVSIVTDDMPFLVSSLANAMVAQGLQLHMVVHPVVESVRDAKGKRAAKGDAVRESVIYLEIDEQPEGPILAKLAEALERVVRDVRASVEDWPDMLAALTRTMEDFKKNPPRIEPDEVDEVLAFLEWLKVGNFTFVGIRDYSFGSGADGELVLEPGQGLGILRDPEIHVLRGASGKAVATPQVQDYLEQPDPLLTMKANIRSTVHRPVYLDYVGVKRFDENGQAIGEIRFVGLFTSNAYTSSILDIPHLRRKARAVMDEAGFSPDSHGGRALLNVLETFPRDELIQIEPDTLYDYAIGIMHLLERPRTRLFMRQDRFRRFCSAIVYMPRERYNSDIRAEVGRLLVKACKGRLSAYYPSFGDGPLARVHFIIGTDPETVGTLDHDDVRKLEDEIAKRVRDWRDILIEALIEDKGEALGNSLYAVYRNAFSVSYRASFDPHIAVSDIEMVEGVKETGALQLALYRRMEDQNFEARFKIFKAGEAVALSDCLPMLENLGVRVISEAAFSIEPRGAEHVALHDFKIETQDLGALELDAVRHHFEEAFARIWSGDGEDDGFNKLVLTAGLGWKDIAILRSYAKYLRQTGTPFSQAFMEDTLNANGAIVRLLIDLFHTRFDPSYSGDRDQSQANIAKAIMTELDAVASLDQDRMIRRFVNLIQSSLRTNLYQRDEDGNPPSCIAIKLDSQKLDGLPLPRPHVEIFVYSPQVEGVHLRGGKVARGGLRWSDRREDFRTEVLGLVKAQMVKNAVIVPVGSKGGFVPKRLPTGGDRDAFLAEGVASYKTFISGLLDVTDNLDGDAIIPPDNVVRHDGDDPYLVVAADKGTASFSDYANDLAVERGFWLGDAFASGGRTGYDHKKMAITARGAWEAVKRHFRELGMDIQNEPFRVIGIGDMSGDVFGNGMLLSKHIKLVAAFDHRDIFIDPDPDCAASFAERQRLFEKARSSWQDYDPSLISEGGGVFSRSVKSIALTPQIQAMIGRPDAKLAPADLINALLKAECDLLWFGGIGTYVKSSIESNADVGDKANDGLRINGMDIGARVVGEGANLGVTQLGRIEASRKGVRLNTDAVDNSAGVDCSDHEVNIKILLNKVVRNGDMTEKQRDQLLVEMTDAVAALVLDDNYRQTQALSITEDRGAEALEIQARFMRGLEREGRLNRAVEFLPNDEALDELLKSDGALTRPELCVLLAYAKLAIFDGVLDSFLPDDPYLERELFLYFPEVLRDPYRDTILAHRLRREIIATRLSNSIVNRGGPTLVSYIEEETGASMPDIVRAYAAARDAFALRGLWDAIDALDTKIDAALQTEMLQRIRHLLRRTVLWLLANSGQPPEIDIEKTVSDFGPCLAELSDNLRECLTEDERDLFDAYRDELISKGVPDALAHRIAGLDAMRSGPDIVEISRITDVPVVETAKAYAVIGAETGLVFLRQQAADLPAGHHWDRQAVRGINDGLFAHQRRMTEAALEIDIETARENGAAAALTYLQARQAAFERPRALIDDMKKVDGVSLSELVVANMAFANL